MADWLGTPLIVTASLAVLYAVVRVIRWTAEVDLKLGQFTDFAREVRDDVKQIFLRLPPVPVAGSSPLRLTDFGERMADFVDAKSWASDLAPSLRAEIAGKRPFEVDEFSRGYVQAHLEDDLQERVAACAYEFGVERDNVLKVLQVVLRDELLGGTAGTERAK